MHEDDSSFSHNLDLSNHQGNYMNEKSYKYDKCGKYFSCGLDLTQHQSFHTEVNPYVIRRWVLGKSPSNAKIVGNLSVGGHTLYNMKDATEESDHMSVIYVGSLSAGIHLLFHIRELILEKKTL